MPSISSIISSLSMEELRAYCQIHYDIDVVLSEGPVENTVGKEYNAVFFTREQLAAWLRFSMSSLVKQFLHFTRAPPALIHPNVIRILIGCCVLNLLYQLDLSLVEVCFSYTLRVAQGGRMSMSTQSPWFQFVTRLPNSPKIEAKGMILVKGPWDETSGSPDLPFDVNHSMFFQVCTSNGAWLLMHFFVCPFYVHMFHYCWLFAQGRARGAN